MRNIPKISAIIPTYNSWGTLKECIRSLMQQSLKPTEIIIVDNASIDETGEEVKKLIKLTKLIKYFKNNKNLGVTGGRNRGIKEADKNSDYIFFFDHDMVAESKMLEELVRVAENKENIGIVTPKIYYWDNKNIIWSAGTDVNLWTGQTIFYGGEDKGQYNEVREVGVAPAAILVKRKVVDKIGGFDTTYFATYEDTDFCFRAKKNGFFTFYTPKAIAYHKIPYDKDDANIRLIKRTYHVARNRIIFMKRYGKSFFLFTFFIPVFFAYYLYLSLKYLEVKSVTDFLKGTVSGLYTK